MMVFVSTDEKTGPYEIVDDGRGSQVIGGSTGATSTGVTIEGAAMT